MLIGFVVAPCSGKSTIASHMFSNFKRDGIPSEIIVEQARQYIAKIRYDKGLPSGSPVNLTDEDQYKIAKQQIEFERVMKHSCGDNTVIVSDSSAINAFIYMSMNAKEALQEQFFAVLPEYDLLFFCNPIDIGDNFTSVKGDANRVHDAEAIRVAQSEAERLLQKIKDSGLTTIIQLNGDLDYRVKEASHMTLQKRHEILSRVA